jgi:hypothetical protein
MRLCGRITVFGEGFGGLMERATCSVPTRQVLVSGDDAARWVGESSYDATLDGVGPALVERRFVDGPEQPIRGDLPIEYGLASSTVIGLLHVGGVEAPRAVEAIAASDGAANGFKPSGGDFAAIAAQGPGIFGLGVWTPVDYILPSGSHLLLPVKERMFDRLTPTLAMRGQRKQLGPLITSLADGLVQGRQPNEKLLLRYARCLLEAGVYSDGQARVIDGLLARGIVAKGVGSMYDRAILVMADISIWGARPPLPVITQTAPDTP